MAESKQRLAAKRFIEQWRGKGYEKGQIIKTVLHFIINLLNK